MAKKATAQKSTKNAVAEAPVETIIKETPKAVKKEKGATLLLLFSLRVETTAIGLGRILPIKNL